MENTTFKQNFKYIILFLIGYGNLYCILIENFKKLKKYILFILNL